MIQLNSIQMCYKKWVVVNHLSSRQYSDLWDYSDACIFVKWTITVEGKNAINQEN